jgi:23S rRNA pseudouridine1911/1915/1917 synthase
MNFVLQTPDWMAVSKPPHLLIHPTRPDGEKNLWDEVRAQFPEEPLSLVNRLDRDTSGLVLVARSPEAASTLGKMTMERKIGKRYLALVSGEAPEEGTIDAPIGRLCAYRDHPIYVQQGVLEEGQPAVTHFRKLDERLKGDQPVSLLEVTLETGRLHQIRVHLQHLGLPVVGDKLYGPDNRFYLDCIEHGWTAEMEQALWIRRHALHAYAMEFVWKRQERRIAIPLAEDLLQFWNELI